MSTCQPVSFEVSRAFWPRLPMASESWSSLVMIFTRLLASSISKALSLAGASALVMKLRTFAIPADDVHLLVVQFADDVLHPLAAQADARADRIHLVVAGPDRQLGAEARFARDALDLDRAIVDLGNFQLEQLDDKARVGAGQNDFRSVRALLDGLDVAADAFADLVFFGRHALRLGSSASYLPRSTITSERSNRRTVPLMMSPTRSLNSVKMSAFSARRICCISACLAYWEAMRPKSGGRDFDFQFFAHLGIGLDPPGVEDGNLVVLGNDLLGDDQLGEGLDVAVLRVNDDAQFARRADRLLGGGQQRFLYRRDQDITADALFPLPEFQDG